MSVTIAVSHPETSRVVSDQQSANISEASEMFRDCSSLATLDVSGWDTRSLADASDMFRGCPAGDGVSLALPGRDEAEREER